MSNKAKAAEFVQEGYQINITGRNITITDAIRNYFLDKITKIERFTDRVVHMNVTFDVQRELQVCHVNLKMNNINVLSEGSTTNMYASIDLAVDRLEKQLIRYKDKIKDHQTRDVATVDMNVNVLQPHRNDDLHDINDDIEEYNHQELFDAYRPHTIVDRDTIPLKRLTYDEAVMKMDLSGDVFLIFRSEHDQKIKVIYRRKDGNYGVIEPEA